MSLRRLNIGLIDADRLDNKTRHPNLALMKISSFCKSNNHEVSLIYNDVSTLELYSYDLLIISKVFTFTELPPTLNNLIHQSCRNLRDLNTCIVDTIKHCQDNTSNKPVISIGGTGFFEDGGRDLHPSIEHIMPDYTLYSDFVKWMVDERGLEETYFDDYLNYSIGFMTRGCFRKCPFCVNKKYDRCEFHAHVDEFLDKSRSKIYLWDDNVLACSKWKDVFDELNATGKPFQFRQGLDIRLMTDEKAAVISKSRSFGDMIFALDNVDDCQTIEEKIRIWRKYSKKTTKFYVLCAFDPWIDPSK